MWLVGVGDLAPDTVLPNPYTAPAALEDLKREYGYAPQLLAITGTATADEDNESDMPRGRFQRRDESSGGEDETLLDTGRAEAMKGMRALTAWWGALTAKQRSALSSEFGGMRKCAQRVDQEGQQ